MENSDEKILLSHGSGGKEEEDLLKDVFKPLITKKVAGSIGFESFDDGGLLPSTSGEIIVSTDNHTVKPLFFPGGNLGSLAAAGSINDTAVMGATPIVALDSIVVEEGFPVKDLKTIVRSMVEIFESNGVELLAGDFKVMPEGEIDDLTINTTVLGLLEDQNDIILDSGAKPGDKILVSGTIGDHGATILGLQKGINIKGKGLQSDCATVSEIINIAKEYGKITAAKDPTRGGIAMALNEIAEKSHTMMEIQEEKIPLRQEVRTLTDMLGVNLLSLTCEGQVIMTVKNEHADAIVKALREKKYNKASIIGEVKEKNPGYVVMETLSGGKRIVRKPSGEIVPRIC